MPLLCDCTNIIQDNDIFYLAFLSHINERILHEKVFFKCKIKLLYQITCYNILKQILINMSYYRYKWM